MASLVNGKRERRKTVTRQELLLAGRRLFSEKGLYESRIEDLARRAGIAKGTLYLYFRSKEDLIEAVVSQGFDFLHRELHERCRGGVSLSDRMRLIAQVHLDFFAENPDLMRIFHQVRGMLKFNRRRWRPLRAPLITHLRRLSEIMKEAPEGEIPSAAERERLAMILFGAASGVASVHAAARPEAPLPTLERDLGEPIAALAEALLHGRRGEPSRRRRSAR